MATENDRSVFSLRLPKDLADQIDGRAAANFRNRNAEIVMLLRQVIDLNTSRDKKLLEAMKTLAT